MIQPNQDNISGKLPAPGHHGQEHFIGTKAAIAENLQLALVAGIIANGPPEPTLLTYAERPGRLADLCRASRAAC